jgi:hypothetical protein
MMNRTTGAVMTVMMLSRMHVVVGDVISRTVVGGRSGGSRACLCVSLIKRHNASELSDHEQADQYRNDPPKAPKPLHR